MHRYWFYSVFVILLLVLLTGCWNRKELDESAFVQGVAIDLTEDGSKLDLTVQFYKPTGGVKSSSEHRPEGNESAVNVRTKDASIFEAIRDMSVHLGRKASWTHLQIIIIGEQLAKKRDIGEVLDFFARDHEPRATISVMIGKGRASDYLKATPFIETNMSRQLEEAQKHSYKYVGKTLKTSFLDLMLEMKSQTEISTVPYVYFDSKNKPTSSPVTGLQIMKKGLVVTTVPSKKIESLLMLMGKYKGGIIQSACPASKEQAIKKMESVEVESIKTKTEVKIKNAAATARILIQVRGYAGELLCSTIKSPEEASAFNKKIQQTLEQDLRETLKILQKKKLDVLGIGNRIFRKNPSLWASWKPDWDERFAQLPITVEVEVNIFNTGANTGDHLAK